jgi:hypothetical protein
MSDIKVSLRLFLILVLCTSLAADNGQTMPNSPQSSQGNRVKEQVSRIKPGSLITVRFTDGSEARGYLTQVDADGFSFRIGDSTTGDQRRTTYDAVKSVKLVKSTHAVAWILTGVVIGAVVIALIVYLTERQNEGG